MDRWRLTVVGDSHQLERLESALDRFVVVGYLDGRVAQRIVDTLNGAAIGNLQKEVAIIGDQVADILQRVMRLGTGPSSARLRCPSCGDVAEYIVLAGHPLQQMPCWKCGQKGLMGHA